MNKKNLSLKVDEYTIHLHRGPEETVFYCPFWFVRVV
jgi:hypothetical protein